MRSLYFIAVGVLMGLGSALAHGQRHSSPVCVPQGAAIYSPGEDHVKAPKLRIVRLAVEQPLTFKRSVMSDVLVNSEGRICDIHIINAPDRETALQVGTYIGEHFRFSPATRDGKSVAVLVRVVVDNAGEVTLPQ